MNVRQICTTLAIITLSNTIVVDLVKADRLPSGSSESLQNMRTVSEQEIQRIRRQYADSFIPEESWYDEELMIDSDTERDLLVGVMTSEGICNSIAGDLNERFHLSYSLPHHFYCYTSSSRSTLYYQGTLD
jgi:hypothetical protein